MLKTILAAVVVLTFLSVNFGFAFSADSGINQKRDDPMKLLQDSMNYLDEGMPACVEVTFWFPNFTEDGLYDIFCIMGGTLCGVERKCVYAEESGYCQQTTCKTGSGGD